MVLTNREGEFQLGDLPEGDVVLEAYLPDVGRGRATVHVVSGRTTSGARIALSGKESPSAIDSTASGGAAVALEDREGVVVTSVAAGSEAERAGLRAGDRILAIDGDTVASAKDARGRLFGPVGDDVVIERLRGTEKQKVRMARERVHR